MVPNLRTVCYVEREAFAAEHLAEKGRAGALGDAPIWSDLSTFDGGPWRGVVDLVTAGFPCQPFSDAGQRRGDADERAVWPEIARIIEECEPGAVFLENVARSAFRRPFADLQRLGFVCHPPVVATSQNFGAPDVRERWFVLATHSERKGLEEWRSERGDVGEERTAAERGGGEPADIRRGRCDRDDEREHLLSAPDGEEPSDGHGHGLTGEWGGWVFDSERQTLRHDPDRCSVRCRICGSPWATESPPVRMDARSATRVDELRAIGNVGAPPLVYAAAFRTLASRLSKEVPC